MTLRDEAGEGRGSGTVISKRHVLTNRHVVEGKTEITIRGWLTEGARVLPLIYAGKVVADDAALDLALVEIVGETWAGPAARLAPAAMPVQAGEDVFVAGAALGKRPHLTRGLLSLESDTLLDQPHIVTSAPIVPGNSGGSLWVRRGRHYVMIGVPRAVATVGFSLVPAHNYAIPMARVRAFLAVSKVPL
jgi:S1-C subfamily serine protease